MGIFFTNPKSARGHCGGESLYLTERRLLPAPDDRREALAVLGVTDRGQLGLGGHPRPRQI